VSDLAQQTQDMLVLLDCKCGRPECTFLAARDHIAALEARNTRLEEKVREAYERAAESAEGERYAQHYVDASASAGDMRPDIYNEACNDVAQAIRSLKGAAK